MSDEEEKETPEEEPILSVPDEIMPITPIGLAPYESKQIEIPQPKKVMVPEGTNKIDDDVSTFSLMRVGLKQLMTTVILLTKAEKAMATTDNDKTVIVETKKWYESKTLWLNGITMAWYFIGPMVGIPILSAEATGMILTGANILLRAITKQPVTIS